MAVVRSVGGKQRKSAVRKRVTKGYSKGRVAYDRRRRKKPLDPLSRQFKDVVQRDPCSICGRPYNGSELHDADHIVSLKSGGENSWTNLGGVCHPCNASKGEKPLLEALLARR